LLESLVTPSQADAVDSTVAETRTTAPISQAVTRLVPSTAPGQASRAAATVTPPQHDAAPGDGPGPLPGIFPGINIPRLSGPLPGLDNLDPKAVSDVIVSGAILLVDAVEAGPRLTDVALLGFKDGLSHLFADPTDLPGVAGITFNELANAVATESFVVQGDISDFAQALGHLTDTDQEGGGGDGTGVTALKATEQGTAATIPKGHTAQLTKPAAVTTPSADAADHASAGTDTKDNSLRSKKSVPKSGTDSTTIKSDATMSNVTKSAKSAKPDDAKTTATSSGATKSSRTKSNDAKSANVSDATKSSSPAAKTTGGRHRAPESPRSSVKSSAKKADSKKSGKHAG
jgi:hypothetical protein